MALETGAETRAFRERFLRLPRELRNQVYADVYRNSPPVPMESIETSPASTALLTAESNTDVDLTAELLEAFYTHSTFSVTFSDLHDIKTAAARPVCWGPYPQYLRHIRELIVCAQETTVGNNFVIEEFEKKRLYLEPKGRAEWERLFHLPRLERLTVKLQKREHLFFCCADFSPVLVHLRESLPKLQVAFSISFDTLLERYWYDPIWENNTQPGFVQEKPYAPMGFVDMTELIGPPTEEDYAYVQEYLPREREIFGRDILRGLLDETPAQRRALALHYVAKEPALLRVRMMAHYEVYKTIRRTG